MALRPRRVIGAVLVLALVLAMGTALWLMRRAAAPAPANRGVWAAVLAGATAARGSTPEAAAVAASGRAAAGYGPNEVEICGGIWIKPDAAGEVDEAEVNRLTRVDELRARVRDGLAADGSDFTRAALLRLEPTREALLRFATTTSDPRAYAIAFNACDRRLDPEPACRQLSAERWAQLDPGNAAPWLQILSDAFERNDVAARDEALHRVATSTHNRIGWHDLMGLIAEQLPPEDSAGVGGMFLIYEVAVTRRVPTPEYGALYSACSADAQRDANRRQVCNAAVEVLVEHGDITMDRMIGVAIGEKGGWPAERVDRIRGENLAYNNAQLEALQAPGNPLACGAAQRQITQSKRFATIGELGALREWVAASGKAPEEFVRMARDAAAASAASAPVAVK